MKSTALGSITVGVVVERHKATSPWLDFVWRPTAALAGMPAAAPWTPLAVEGDVTTFYAGVATIELHRTETDNYRRNLATGLPLLWVVLRPTSVEPPYELFAVTADPAEGEAYTETGTDMVETVPMPSAIVTAVEQFIAEHHVDRPFFKRQRDTTVPDALNGKGGRRSEP